jgi:hypothetical protein
VAEIAKDVPGRDRVWKGLILKGKDESVHRRLPFGETLCVWIHIHSGDPKVYGVSYSERRCPVMPFLIDALEIFRIDVVLSDEIV